MENIINDLKSKLENVDKYIENENRIIRQSGEEIKKANTNKESLEISRSEVIRAIKVLENFAATGM